MKKLIAVLFAISFTGSLAHGQLYLKGGVGYALSLGGVQIDRDRTETASFNQFSYIYGATGGGFEAGAAVGYTASSSVAFELGVWYEFGQSYEANDVRLNPAQNRERVYSGTLFGLAPAMVVSGEMGGLRPYARVGILVGFPTAETKETRPTPNTITDKFSGGLLFGFHGAGGVVLAFQDNLSIFVELALQGGSWSPTKLEETDQAASTTTTFTLKSDFNDSEPFVAPQPAIPFGNVGVRAGVKINL